MKLLYFTLISFFLLSCQTGNLGDRSDSRDVRSRDIRGSWGYSDDDRGGNFRKRDRESELRRLKGSGKPVISSTLDRRYSGFSYSEYDGDDCEESRSCKDLCDKMFSRRYRNKCYRSPEKFVEDLEDGLFELISISEVESVKIGAGFVASVLKIDEDIIVDLVEDKMSEGDLRSFLAWVAVNEDVSEAFLDEDSSSKVLRAALEELGAFQEDVLRSRKVETGLNMGLIEEEDTFLSLAELEDNSPGFQIGYEVLEKACSSKECKLDVLCSREDYSLSRSRVFGQAESCGTSTSQTRRIRAGGTCYLQGASVWSFLTELIEDREIRDNDFAGNPLTVDQCNRYCGGERANNRKCNRVLTL